jgi:short-subunit dehydrogenase
MQNYTLVTGASTGIGRAIVEELIRHDHIVFAGARKESDLQSLKALGQQVIPLKLDVTKPEEIRKAFLEVSPHLKEHFCFHLVNNAGIVAPGPIEGLNLDQLRQQFEVNVFGVVAVTQAFLPILRQCKGRIVMMSSISGLTSTPFLGAYSGSKFALEAISDSLRVELESSGVKVLIIQPGPIMTPIWEKGFSQEKLMLENLPIHILETYKNSLAKFTRTTKKEIKKAIPAEKVALAVAQCLKDPNPRLRQIVAALPIKTVMKIAKFLPTSIIDKELKRAYISKN